ncbi:uncharacterized protein B0H64DRAFT_458567 [Chaetomium fimeti]|uniref:Uncharacterized protein n=1 Tax=Chaetomium fimeti TaxID=1854472 RepID=A0AAE0HKM1_9PEZI|nr:hypothetical protein B0H64DRAFT_458567 [Chaetomium fimeti]
MPRGEHQEPASGPPGDTIDDERTGATLPTISSSSRSAPSEKCDAACCRNGSGWLRYQHALTDYANGPGVDTLVGAWSTLKVRIDIAAERLERFCLARWRDLSPSVREKLESWSPAARELWESDFAKHQEALVQVWIWRYVEETLFFFSNSTASPDGDAACCSPVWEHVRTLTRDLQPVRTLKHDEYLENVCRIQFNGWRRITEHLVRMGLGLKEFATPAVLMAHCKKSLRQLLVDGETQLPDLAHDADWRARGDGHDAIDKMSFALKRVFESALKVQYCIHGLEGTYSLRFTPIDSDSDQPWGFPFEDGPMRLFNPPELNPLKDDGGLPSVQLVCVPMLTVNKRYDEGFGKVFTQKAPMSVVTPRVFAGEEAWSNCKEYVEKRRAKRRRIEADTRRAAGQPAEGQLKGVRRSGRSGRIKVNRERAVEAQQSAQQKAMERLQAEQQAEADELLAKQKTEVEALQVKQAAAGARLAKKQARAKALLAKEQQAAAKALLAR